MKVLSKIYNEIEIEPIELTLLSKEEYVANRNHIHPLNIYRCWWLRSPSFNPNYETIVSVDNSLSCANVGLCLIDVRPVMKFKSNKMWITDRLKFGGHTWTVITSGMALCDTVIDRMSFRQDWQTPDANDFQRSEVKRYLDNLFEQICR